MRLLCLAVLAIASVGWAQQAPGHFLIELELTPGVDVTHLSEAQISTFQQHGARLAKLCDEGVVIVGGRTANLQHPRAVVIVTAKDAAAARSVVEDDPAVKAGLMKASVEPFALLIPPR